MRPIIYRRKISYRRSVVKTLKYIMLTILLAFENIITEFHKKKTIILLSRNSKLIYLITSS